MKAKFTDNLIITIVVLGMLLLASIILFMSTKTTSYAVDLNNQNDQTNNPNVTFDVGFENAAGNLEHSAVLDINPEWRYLYVRIGLTEGSTLINPTVRFYDSSNGSNINFDLGKGFGNITAEYIKATSASNKTVQFEDLTTGLNFGFSTSIDIKNSMNIAKLNETSKAVFTATLRDPSGNTYAISKDIYFNIGWTGNLSMNIAQTVESFSHINNGGADNLVIETEVIAKIDSSGKYNILPVRQTQLVIDVPTYQGIAPTSVNVTSKKTGATNGKSDSAVVFNNSNWSYNSTNRKLTITVNNTDPSNAVTVSRDYDKYDITYTYPQAAYDAVNTSGVDLINKITGTMTLYSNTSTTQITKTLNDTMRVTNYMDKNSNGTFLKPYLYFNTLGKYTNDLTYSYGITYKNRNRVEGQKDKEIFEQVKFKAKNGTEYNSFISGVNYIPITRILVPVNSFRAYFGASGAGSIEVYEDDRALIGTITASTTPQTIDGQNYYVLSIPEAVRTRAERISIVKTAPATELAELQTLIERQISKNLPYTISQIQSFTQTYETLKGYHTTPSNPTVFEYETGNDLTMINDFIETYTNANFNVTTSNLKAEVVEQDLEFDIALDNSRDDTDVWKEPYIDIVLPEYIIDVAGTINTNVNIGASDTIYAKSYCYIRKYNNKIHIIMPFDGEQKGLFNTQTIIHIKTRVKVDPYATNSSKEVLLYYTNKYVTTYKNPSTWPLTPSTTGESADGNVIFADGTACGIAKSEINFFADPNLLCVSEISNYDGTKTIDSLYNKDKADKIPREVTTNPKMTIIAQNNHTVPISNVSLLGRIPYTDNKYAIQNINLGTNINTELLSRLTTTSGKSVTIYYSDNLDATKDLALATNNWKTEVADLSKVRSYLIVINDTMAPGEQIRFTYDFKLPSKINYNKMLYANFGGYYTADGVDRTAEADKVGLATERGPILDLEKISTIQGGGTKVKEDSIIVYAITIQNRGDIIAQDVEITDIIPENTVYVETDATGAYVESPEKTKFVHKINTLNVGETAVCSFAVKVKEITENTTIRNTATAVAEGVDQVESNTDEIPAIPTKPILSVTKKSDIADGTTVSEGDKITYTITVHNSGDGKARNVIIKDSIPENTNYYNAETDRIDTAITEITTEPRIIKPGEDYIYTFTVVVKELDSNKTISNTATITADNIEADITSNTVNINAMQKFPNLEITKTSDITAGTTVKEGDLITYTITVKNTGEGNAKNVVIKDTIPANTIYYDTETNTTKPEVTIINSDAKEILKPNESFVYTFKVKVGRISTNKVISNIAKVVADNFAEKSSTNADVNAVITAPNLKITKTSDIPEGTAIKAGHTITYTIKVENIGTVPAYDVSIKDKVPDHTTYYEGGARDSAKKNVGKDIEVINPGETATYSFTVILDEIEVNTIIENTASVTAENLAEQKSNKVNVNATPKVPNLEVTKTADKAEGTTVKEGDLITYTITVKNIGDGIAKDIVINDTIPESTVYYDTETNTAKPSIKTINSEVKATLNPEETFTFTFKVKVGRISANKAIQNTAKVTSSNLGEVASNTTSTNAVITVPNLKITKTSNIAEGTTIKDGSTITYKIKVENIGTAPAYDVSIKDKIPDHTIYYEEEMKDPSKKNVGKDIAIINLGESEEYSFTVIVDKINEETIIENTATVTAENAAEQTSNKVSINAIPRVPSLEVVKSHSIPSGPEGIVVREGDIIEYIITVRNIGDGEAKNVKITDKVPDGTIYYNTTTNAIDSSKKEVASEVKEILNPGETFTFTFKVKVGRVSAAKAIRNTAKVVSDNLEDETSNTVSINAKVTVPNLKITKTSDVEEGKVIKAGKIITYTINVENLGTKPAYDVTIKDKVPDNTTYYKDGAKNSEIKELREDIGTIEPGKNATYSFQVMVDEIDENILIENTASVTAENLVEQTSNKVTINAVPKVPELEVTKVSDIAEGETVKEGKIVTYTITVKNIGDGTAKNVKITDNIPEHTIYYEEAAGNREKRTVEKDIGAIEPGNSAKFSFQVVIDEITENTVIENTASVTAENAAEQTSNKVTINAVPKVPELEVTKVSDIAEGETVKEGKIVTYTITVKNIGDGTAKNVKITDNIPEHTIYYEEAAGNREKRTVEKGIGAIEPGNSAKFSFQVVIDEITENTAIENIASVTAENLAGKTSNKVIINAIPKAPKLEVTKTSSIPEGAVVREGDLIKYAITVKNVGDAPAKNVIIKDTVPEDTVYYNTETNAPEEAKKAVSSETKETLGINESFSYEFTVQVKALDKNKDIQNIASASGKDIEDVLSNNVKISAKAKLPVLEATKTSSVKPEETVKEGDIIEYKISVKNVGEAPGKNVVIKDKIPEGTIYYDEETKQAKPEITTVNSDTKETLDIGESFEYSFKVQIGLVKEGTKITNTATVLGENVEATPSNTSEITPEITAPKLKLEKTSSIENGKTIISGTIIEYKIVVTNIGDCTAHNVVITDPIPANTTYVEKVGSKYETDANRKEVTKVIESLAPGESQTLTFSVKVNKLNANIQITNTAKVNAINGEETSSNSVGISAKPDDKKEGKLPYTGKYSLIIISLVGVISLSVFVTKRHKKIRK